jgi:hypothetical protein
MARKPANQLEEYTINVGGVDLTVQLTPEDAEAQNATKGKALADRTPTVPRDGDDAGVVTVDDDGDGNPFETKATKAPANKAATAPANK